ncbi:MAG: hypothetical protein ACYC2Z_09475 [Candidatus Nanopelagicales bacterium]
MVIDAALARSLAAVPVARSALARGGAAASPVVNSSQPVLEHGLRHLAWLVQDDEIVAALLSVGWPDVPFDDVPEPFRHLRS